MRRSSRRNLGVSAFQQLFELPLRVSLLRVVRLCLPFQCEFSLSFWMSFSRFQPSRGSPRVTRSRQGARRVGEDRARKGRMQIGGWRSWRRRGWRCWRRLPGQFSAVGGPVVAPWMSPLWRSSCIIMAATVVWRNSRSASPRPYILSIPTIHSFQSHIHVHQAMCARCARLLAAGRGAPRGLLPLAHADAWHPRI